MKTKIGYGLILIGLLGLITLGFGFAQSPPKIPPKPTKVFEEKFKFFVHGVAVDSTLENWEVRHTGSIDKTIILTTQNLSIRDDGDVSVQMPVSNLKRIGNDWFWYVEERHRKTEIWHWNSQDKLLRRGFRTNLGNFHPIRYYPKARSIPLNSKFK